MFFPSCPSFHFVYLFRGCYHDKLLSWDDHAMTITSRAWPLRWTIASEARQPLGKGFWKVWCFSTSKVVNTMPWTYHLGWFIHVSTIHLWPYWGWVSHWIHWVTLFPTSGWARRCHWRLYAIITKSCRQAAGRPPRVSLENKGAPAEYFEQTLGSTLQLFNISMILMGTLW